MMFSGIGIVVLLVGTLSQRRLQRVESRLKSKTEVQPRLLGDETKTAIKNKIEGIEKLTEEDFDALIIMMKSLRPGCPATLGCICINLIELTSCSCKMVLTVCYLVKSSP